MLTSDILATLERLSSQVLAELEAVPAAALNWQPPLHDANSLYVIAQHTVAAGEWLTLHLACGQPYTRDRDAEFRGQGDLAALRTRYEAWLAAARPAVSPPDGADLAEVRRLPDGGKPPSSVTSAAFSSCRVPY
ncbi:MAG: hypothetical protein KIS91_03975 [Anaerolineae bacterium]|nr:hypothetical protein [Anaerolineae bacterium]